MTRDRQWLFAVLVLLVGGVFLRGLSAATITWSSASSGNWDTGANWGGGAEPGSGDDARILTDNITVTINSAGNAVNSLLVSEKPNGPTLEMTGGSLSITGDFNLANSATNGQRGTYRQTAGTLTIGGDWNVANVNNASAVVDIQGGVVNVTGVIRLSTAGNPQNSSFTTVGGAATINGDIIVGDKGTLTGTGTINGNVTVENGGTLGSELQITSDDFTVNNGGTFHATLHDGSPPSFDIVSVVNTLSLAATSGGSWTLQISDDNGFDDIATNAEEFVLWQGFSTLKFGTSTITSGSGTISNVTITAGSPAPPSDQLTPAILGYRFTGSVGEVYLTNVAPLPGPLLMGAAGLGALILAGWRRRRFTKP